LRHPAVPAGNPASPLLPSVVGRCASSRCSDSARLPVAARGVGDFVPQTPDAAWARLRPPLRVTNRHAPICHTSVGATGRLAPLGADGPHLVRRIRPRELMLAHSFPASRPSAAASPQPGAGAKAEAEAKPRQRSSATGESVAAGGSERATRASSALGVRMASKIGPHPRLCGRAARLSRTGVRASQQAMRHG